MKKIISVLLSVSILLSLFSFSSFAATIVEQGKCGENVTYTLDSNGLLTISGTGEMEDYYTKSPFNGNRLIKSVVINKGVTSIGTGAFYMCSSIESVTIPDSVTSIGIWAFESCSSLTSITIPNSVTSINRHVFRGCSNLTSITIPDSVTSIGGYAFEYCSRLTSITIPDSVKAIGEYAFLKTGYYNNESNWHNGVLYIGKYLIEAEESISGIYSIKNGTKTIADYAFYNCAKLTSITIPDSVTNIGIFAFEYCQSVTSILIPDSVTSIGGNSFEGCRSLTSIIIPDSVTSIGGDAFNFCHSLKDVYYGGSKEDKNKISIDMGNNDLLNATWHYNFEPYTVYTKALNDNSADSPSKRQFDHPLEYYLNLTSSTTYNTQLAEILMWFAHSSYIDGTKWDSKNGEVYIKRTLKSFGFPEKDIYTVNYYVDANESTTCAFSVAKKELSSGKKLIMITVRGTGTDDLAGEWYGNLSFSDLGTSIGTGWHPNFEECANMIYKTLSDCGWLNKSGDYIYCVTGHSKGAAVANLTSVKLSDYGVKKENLYDYNFACPDVAVGSQLGWNNNGEHDNMFNINNICDIVPYTPAIFVNHMSYFNAFTTWGKFGVSKWFSLNWEDSSCVSLASFFSNVASDGGIPTSYIKSSIKEINGSFINPHDPRAYLAYMSKQQNLDCMVDRERALVMANTGGLTSLIASICCPVDFTVTDKNGNVLAECIDGNPKYYDCKDNYIVICVNGDEKSVLVSNPKDVDINLIATDSGTMEFTVEHLGVTEDNSNNKNTDCYKNVTLIKGKTMEYSCINTEDLSKNNLYVVDNKGNDIALINNDGTETKLENNSLGDVDGDGKINSSDALLVLQHTVGTTTLTGKALVSADVTKDTMVNSSDALMILQYTVGKINKF